MLSVLLNCVRQSRAGGWYMAVIVAVCLCSSLFSGEWPMHRQNEAERKVDKIINLASRSIERKYAVKCIGSGAQMFQGPIRKVSLSFSVVGPLSVPELRRLLVACVHETLAAANSIRDLYYYMAAPPFTLKNISIDIFQRDANGRGLCYPVYDVGSFIKGELEYAATDPRPQIDGNPYKSSWCETYEQALEAMRKEYQQCQQDTSAEP